MPFDYGDLEEIDEGIWTVYYGPVFPGWLDEEDYRIEDTVGG